MSALDLVTIDVRPGSATESQSGLMLLRPRIYGAFADAGAGQSAAILMHPTSNFMGHYLIAPLAERGLSCLALNSRYGGNDSQLLMERVIQDLGAGVAWLRERGYRRIVLIGNSGGAALAAYYQAQAEQFDCTRFVHGAPTGFSADDFLPADGIVLSAAHPGRSRLFLEWIDPALTDEQDPLSLDPSLDMYDARNGPPYSPGFLARFRQGQIARRDRIESWVLNRIELLRSTPGAPADQAFVIHRTHADPRFLDLSLDANDRPRGSIWGDARTVNYAGNAVGRYTSLTSFLSQWSSCSAADGPTNLIRTSVPVLLITHTADGSTYPSTRAQWLAAAGSRVTELELDGANHYLAGQPAHLERTVTAIDRFAASL